MSNVIRAMPCILSSWVLAVPPLCRYINGMTLDDRPVRADFDWGFKEGRQFGRGRSGGQVCAQPTACSMHSVNIVHGAALL